MKIPIGRTVLALLVALAVTAPGSAQIECAPCTVGLVLDGPWERNDEVRAIFEREVLDLVGPDFDIVFPAEKRLLADWTLDGARDAVERLLADPEVDLLLTSGPVASTYAGRRASFPKPVIAAFVVNPEAQGVPIETDDQGERVSGVTNLSYITFPGSVADELRRFREVVPFRRLTYLANEGLMTAVPELEDNVRREVADLGVELTLVRVGTSVEAAIAAIPATTEAVYVVPLIQLPPGDFDRLVAELIKRRLPTFSYWGRSEVDRGLLTSIYLDTDFQRLGRRIALNLQRILRGEEPGTIAVDFRRSQRLTLNMATARAIGAYPSWSIITEAELLDDERLEVQRELDLATAAREAITANLDVLATERFVAAGVHSVRAARSALYPQLSISSQTQLIDQDRAQAGLGSQP